ncbi:MAG: right-handed parallel beta-helix repeat-containing protein [Candidatus Thorarchaeota archaeon]
MRRLVLGAIICFILIPFSASTSIIVYQWDTADDFSLAQKYIDHDFIAIFGNGDFLSQAASEGWSGSGTADDPIIISGYRIQMSRHLFRAVNTDLHFIFTDNYLDGIDSAWCGLYMANVTNGVVRNTIVCNSATAFHMIALTNCTLANNTIFDNVHEGIGIELPSVGNNITDNHIFDNMRGGIFLDYGSQNNTIARNSIHDNMGTGIHIWSDSSTLPVKNNWIKNNSIIRESNGISIQGHGNFISENTIVNSYRTGILCSGENNLIIDNIVQDGRRDGIKLYSSARDTFVCTNSIQNNTNRGVIIDSTSSNNTVMLNDFLANNYTCQVWDDGGENVFQNNYYSSWNAPDENQDGIVDIAYPIGGDAESLDSDPSTLPNCEIPNWYTYIEVPGTSTSNTVQNYGNYQLPLIVLGSIFVVVLGIVVLRSRRM